MKHAASMATGPSSGGMVTHLKAGAAAEAETAPGVAGTIAAAVAAVLTEAVTAVTVTETATEMRTGD